MYDPTFTGEHRRTLEPISKSNSPLSFFSPPNLTGKPQRSSKTPVFSDKHKLFYSRFDHKGSVLFANIDAVLNLTGHIGGYMAPSTQNNNMHYYSLFFEDRNLELYSYVQWRLPYSITRLVSAKSVGRPDLESVNLDLVNFDIPVVLSGRPVDNYDLVGIISHHVISLRALTIIAMTMFSSITAGRESKLLTDEGAGGRDLAKAPGKGFIVMPYGSEKGSQGSLSLQALTDFIILLDSLFTEVYLFRPYMCYEYICIGVGAPKKYPVKCSDEENQLLSIWTMLNLTPEVDTTSPLKVNPVKDFGRLFDAIDVNSNIADKVMKVVQAPEPKGRDRVEVLSRWQIPDQRGMTFYPRFVTRPMIHDNGFVSKKKEKPRERGQPRPVTP